MRDDVVSELREKTGHGGGGGAAVGAVAMDRHEAGGLGQRVEIGRPRRARLDRPQRLGEAGGADRAGRTLPTRLALEEGRQGCAYRQGTDRGADDEHRGGAEGRARLSQCVGVKGRVEPVGDERRGGGAGGEDHPHALGCSSSLPYDAAQWRSQRDLIHARLAHVAPERDQRRFRGAEALGIGDGGGHARKRLHVLDQGRPATEAHGRRKRRLRPGPRAASLEYLEDGRLLARDVAVVAPADPDAHAVEGHLDDGALQGGGGGGKRALQIDDRLARADRLGGENEPADHLAGSGQHHPAVLDRARLTFGAVADDERLASFDPNRLPLSRRREPTPAPAPEARGLQPADQLRAARALRVLDGRAQVASAEAAIIVLLTRFPRASLRPGFPVRSLSRRRARLMINLTAAAAEKVKGILEQEKTNIPQGGLRIYVQGGGCSGFSYGMVLDEAADGDEVVEVAGVKVIVDPMSLRYLEGAEVDYKEDLMGGGFAIKNPNATSTCGCGHSFNAGGEGAGEGGGHHH